MVQNTRDPSSLGFAGCCAWSGAHSLVRCLNMLCDVDFVLLWMIYFYAELRSGPLPNLGARSVSTVCFCIFFACRCCIDVLTGAESAGMKSSSSSRTASSYSVVSG